MMSILHEIPNLSIGAIVVIFSNVAAIGAGLWRIHKVASRMEFVLDRLETEHEMLVQFMCKHEGLDINKLPTRLKTAPWWRTNGIG